MKDMRDWREFEKLAAEIEDALSPQGAKVTCPDRIPDSDTGELREVDASIRYQVGSVPILIILECRYRKSRQGTIWIEQLSEKRKSVGAAKCIAVSLSPFSKPAVKKAASLGVELRNLRSFDRAELMSLAPITSLHYLCKFDHVSITFSDAFGEKNEFFARDAELNDKLWNQLGHKLTDRLVNYDGSARARSIGEYLINLIDAVYDHSKKDSFFVPELNKKYIFSFVGECAAEINLGGKRYRLGGATFWVSFSSFFDALTRIDSASFYSAENRIIAARTKFTITTSDGPHQSVGIVSAEEVDGFVEKCDDFAKFPKSLIRAGSLTIAAAEPDAKGWIGRFPSNL